MISKTLLSELNVILEEDYKTFLPPAELADIANTLVNFFELSVKIDLGYVNENKNYEYTILS